jgi:hypothetical protein
MPADHNRRKRMKSDSSSRADGPGIARARWMRFVDIYNKAARTTGAPQIGVALADLTTSSAGSHRALTNEEVRSIQIDYYEAVIDAIDPLARQQFEANVRQRERAKKNRKISPITVVIRAIASDFDNEGFVAKKLWPKVCQPKIDSLRITEAADGLSIVWSDEDSEERGTLTFHSFETALSRERAKIRSGAKPAKKKSTRTG